MRRVLTILSAMNKTLLFAATVAGALGVAATAAAQPKLVKKWESDASFKVPESVYFDKAGKVLYVSNIEGEPWGKDGAGSIGKLGLDGKVIAAEWVKGLNAPKGMALSKGTLWVADLSDVVGIDVAKGAIATRVAVPGATRLNDVTMDAKGAIYVSDSETKKVHKIEGTTVTTLLEGLKGPNGLLAHGADLYLLDSGTLYQVQADKKLKMLAEGMEGGTDGVEPIKGGGFVVSTWGGVIYHVGADGTKHVLMDTREQKQNSADIALRSGHGDGLRADVLQEHRHRLHAAVAFTWRPRSQAGPPAAPGLPADPQQRGEVVAGVGDDRRHQAAGRDGQPGEHAAGHRRPHAQHPAAARQSEVTDAERDRRDRPPERRPAPRRGRGSPRRRRRAR